MSDLVQFRLTNKTKFAELAEHLRSMPQRDRADWLRNAALEKLRGSELEELKVLISEQHQELTDQMARIIELLERKRK